MAWGQICQDIKSWNYEPGWSKSFHNDIGKYRTTSSTNNHYTRCLQIGLLSHWPLFFWHFWITVFKFGLLSSGANCAAGGLETIKSQAGCHEAAPTIQALGFTVVPRGTVSETQYHGGCYIRPDGHLWFNSNLASPTHCKETSKCVCIKPTTSTTTTAPGTLNG